MTSEEANAFGWFNYGTSYLRAAQELLRINLHVSHKDAPIEFLYYHATELLLKAYLVHHGVGERQLKKLSHDIMDISKECEQRGLTLTDAHRETLGFIQHQGNLYKARYIKLGVFQRADFKEMDRLAAHLAHIMRDALYAQTPVC